MTFHIRLPNHGRVRFFSRYVNDDDVSRCVIVAADIKHMMF